MLRRWAGIAGIAALGLGAAQSQTFVAPPERKLWSLPDFVHEFFYGPASADGRYIAYGSRQDGELYLHDFRTGQERRVTFDANPGLQVDDDVQRFSDDISFA